MLLIIPSAPRPRTGSRRRTSRSRDFVVTLIELPLVLPPAVAGIGLLAAFGRLGLLGGTFEALGIDVAFNKVGRGPRRHLRRQPVLRPHGRLGARGDRPDAPRRRPDARCRAGTRLLPRRAAARGRRARRRRGARLRARDRRVRRHDHVRRLAPGRDPDALARDLRAVRPRLQRRARDQRRARAHQRGDPPLRQAPDPMALSVTSPIPFAASTRPSS